MKKYHFPVVVEIDEEGRDQRDHDEQHDDAADDISQFLHVNRTPPYSNSRIPRETTGAHAAKPPAAADQSARTPLHLTCFPPLSQGKNAGQAVPAADSMNCARVEGDGRNRQSEQAPQDQGA